MTKTKKLISAALMLALSASTVFSCAIQANAAGGRVGKPVILNHKPTKKVDPNGFLQINLNGEIPSLDTNIAEDNVSFRIIGNVNECLTRQEMDPKGNVVNGPGAAERWEISPDGLKWTFYLRKLNWSDGKPVTAKDFEYSWLRVLNPKVASSYSFFLYFIKGAEEYNMKKGALKNVGIRALSQSKFEIVLKRPSPVFEKMLSFPLLGPVRADIVKKLGDKFGSQSGYKQMVWSGPFVVSSWNLGQKCILKKNPKYWDSKNVYLQEASYLLSELEPATSVQMFKNNKIDRVSPSGDYLALMKDYAKEGKARYEGGNDMNVRYFNFHQANNPIFKSDKVRKAFALAIDRELYCKVVMKRFIPRYSLVPKGIMASDVEFRKISQDWLMKVKNENTDIKKLLIQGLKDLKLNPDPSKYEVEYLNYGGNSTVKKQTEYFQDQWQKNLGVKVKIKTLSDFGTWIQARNKGDFQIVYAGWGADYNDPMTFLDMWITGSPQNHTGYSSKKYDKIVADAQKEINPEKRKKLLVEAEKVLIYEDCAIAPFATDDLHFFWNKAVNIQGYFNFGCDTELKYAYTSGR